MGSTRTEGSYRATVGRAVESFAVDGPVTAQWKSKPLGKEIVTARRMSANGHAVEFLAAVGAGRHPDVKVDGIVAELKRPDSFVPNAVYTLLRKANRQGARCTVIDLALDRIGVDEAIGHAKRAIGDGFMPEGSVFILDWRGAEHIV